MERKQISNRLISVLCLNDNTELPIHVSFYHFNINEKAEKQLVDVYYLFKRANLNYSNCDYSSSLHQLLNQSRNVQAALDE